VFTHVNSEADLLKFHRHLTEVLAAPVAEAVSDTNVRIDLSGYFISLAARVSEAVPHVRQFLIRTCVAEAVPHVRNDLSSYFRHLTEVLAARVSSAVPDVGHDIKELVDFWNGFFAQHLIP
jgi:hypothetical protein